MNKVKATLDVFMMTLDVMMMMMMMMMKMKKKKKKKIESIGHLSQLYIIQLDTFWTKWLNGRSNSSNPFFFIYLNSDDDDDDKSIYLFIDQ